MICAQRWVGEALGQLGDSFLNASLRQGVGALADRIADVAVAHILECGLGTRSDRCDYSLALLRGTTGFPSDLWRSAACPPDNRQHDSYARLAGPGAAGLPEAEIIWLEFDFDAKGTAGRASVFAATGGPASHTQASRLAEALQAALTPDAPRIDLAPWLAALPNGVFLKQVGIMAGRPDHPTGLRLVLDGVVPGAVPGLLNQMGWPGSAAAAARISHCAARLAGAAPCRVDLDLRAPPSGSEAALLGPALGIEVTGMTLAQTPDPFGILHRAGLCSADKAAALRCHAPRQPLRRMNGETGRSHLDFGLNHLKLSASDLAGAESAKAYFSLLHLPDFQPPDP